MLSLIISLLDTQEERDRLSAYYEKYSPLLLRSAFDRLHDLSDAEDAVHDVFLAAAKKWSSLSERGERDVKHFLFICIRNRAISILRRRKKLVSYEESVENGAKPFSDEEYLSFPDSPADAAIAEEIKSTINSLDQRTADVIWMHVQGYSFEEIAEFFGEKPETIKKRLYRGKKKLARVLGKKGDAAQ